MPIDSRENKIRKAKARKKLQKVHDSVADDYPADWPVGEQG